MTCDDRSIRTASHYVTYVGLALVTQLKRDWARLIGERRSGMEGGTCTSATARANNYYRTLYFGNKSRLNSRVRCETTHVFVRRHRTSHAEDACMLTTRNARRKIYIGYLYRVVWNDMGKETPE